MLAKTKLECFQSEWVALKHPARAAPPERDGLTRKPPGVALPRSGGGKAGTAL